MAIHIRLGATSGRCGLNSRRGIVHKSVDEVTLTCITIPDIARRNMPYSTREVSREILLSFWKVHILHHASEAPLHGQWMLTELRHHGYHISPGTLYPLLQRMERLGWLKGKADRRAGPRARRDYRLTTEGKKVLEHVRGQIEELYDEVVSEAKKGRK